MHGCVVSVKRASPCSAYGVGKKQTNLAAGPGLGMETAILAPIAVGDLIHALISSNEIYTWNTAGLLALGGPITTVPLLLFAASSKHVPLAIMGMLQYVGPSIQFAIGAFIDREPIDRWRIAGFCCVWIALSIFSLNGLFRWIRSRPTPKATSKNKPLQ